MEPRRLFVPVLVLLAAGGLATACSSSDNGPPVPGDSGSSGSSGTSGSSGEPADATVTGEASTGSGSGDAGDAGASGSDAGDASSGAISDAGDAAAATGGPFVYFADNGGSRLFAFTLNPTTGALASIDFDPASQSLQASLGTEGQPMGVAALPNGRWVYTAERNGDVGQYAIDPATGIPSIVNRATTDGGLRDFNVAGAQFESIGIDAKGRVLYVPDVNNDLLYTLPIDPATGQVSMGRTLAVQKAPRGVGVDPAGNYLYATGNGEPVVARIPLDPSTGYPIAADAGGGPTYDTLTNSGNCLHADLSPAGNAYTVCEQDQNIYAIGYDAGITTLGFAHAGGAPIGVTVHPNGRFAYASSASEGSIYAFSLDGTGAPSTLGTPKVFGYLCRTLAFDPRGAHLIAGCDGQMFWFNVDADAGTLSTGGNVASGTDSTYSMAIVSPPLR